MKTGRLREVLTIWEMAREGTAYGELDAQVPTLVAADVYAERVKRSSRIVREAAELFADTSVWFNIHLGYIDKVRLGHVVEDFMQIRYAIRDIEPNIQRGYIIIKCDRINE